MEQHPIPQNVTAYQFHLVGDMTLKQFLELVSGGAVGLLFYATNLPAVIKWALIIFSILSGFAFAFLPLEERPLDRWLMAFIKAAYRPLQFIWKKSPPTPEIFTFVRHQQPVKKTPATHTKPLAKPKPTKNTDITQQEKTRLDQILNLFQSEPNVAPTTLYQEPQEQLLKRPKYSQHAPGKQSVKIKSRQVIQTTTPSIKQSSVSQPLPKNVTLPTPPKATAVATTSTKLPFPSLPDQPNVLVGMVLDSEGKIVENAIIEIKDKEGHPVRATKTNKLGQFFSVTPLIDGTYSLETEKDNLSFDIMTLTLDGIVYPPLEIRAQSIPKVQKTTIH